ncbi:MAG: nicotinate-nucleotide adenylyltransferase [Dehalococcoidia bacterium]|nr:Nicotinate-nucleotide adenylyltransferase [Chloroflexota bacterium]MBT9160915.1 Nicotinate-nucleotide adenylyltransferase [Chloroflexota bacterium]MBT9162301.1 Nicotinate-nucleotide adenylyltransferase [Chloroflexota bacterium]
MEIGLLGGTFDPVHLGHLIIAEEVRCKLGLSKVVFIPAGQPWLKVDRVITRGEHRLAMVRLAIASNPFFEVSLAELERSGPSYSVDTVSALRDEYGPEVGLYFIVGPDALVELHRWKEPARLAGLCQLIVVGRPSSREEDLSALHAALPGISSRIRCVDVPQIGISSTEIRQRVRAGASIRYLVPPGVERYIYEQELYFP